MIYLSQILKSIIVDDREELIGKVAEVIVEKKERPIPGA